MPTRFKSLGNNGIGAMRFQPQSFVDGGGAGEYFAAPGFKAVDQFGVG